MSTTPSPERPRRPLHGTQAELEQTQVWWLRWVYGPVMGAIAIAAVAVNAVDGFGNEPAWIVLGLVVGGLLGAAARFRQRRRHDGRLSLDERDETQTMRTMGYGYCFAFFGVLIWAVVWAAAHGDDGGLPAPFLALAGLVVAMLLGRLCTAREGF